MKKKRRDYSKIRYDDIPEKIEPERIIIKSSIEIDYSVFQKDAMEKKTLKFLKAQIRNNV